MRDVFFSAAQHDNYYTLKSLATLGFSVNMHDERNGKTVFHYATKGQSKSIVRYLVTQNADRLSRDHFGNTPLHYAASWPDIEVISSLYQRYDDFLVPNNFNRRPIDIARENDNQALLNFFLPLERAAVDVNTNFYIRSLRGALVKKELDISDTLSCPISLELIPDKPCVIRGSSRWWQIYDYESLLRCENDPLTRQAFDAHDLVLLDKQRLYDLYKSYAKEKEQKEDKTDFTKPSHSSSQYLAKTP